jgi:hypothetical protein
VFPVRDPAQTLVVARASSDAPFDLYPASDAYLS